MTLRRIIFILIMAVSLAAAPAVTAQRSDRQENEQRWRNQLREYKHNFLAHDLNLSAEQKTKFFPLYDEMDERLEALNAEARDINRKILSDKKLSDVALDAYSRRLFEQKQLESEIELEYYDKFKTILTSKQLARLKHTEMEIVRNLNKFYRERRRPAEN